MRETRDDRRGVGMQAARQQREHGAGRHRTPAASGLSGRSASEGRGGGGVEAGFFTSQPALPQRRLRAQLRTPSSVRAWRWGRERGKLGMSGWGSEAAQLSREADRAWGTFTIAGEGGGQAAAEDEWERERREGKEEVGGGGESAATADADAEGQWGLRGSEEDGSQGRVGRRQCGGGRDDERGGMRWGPGGGGRGRGRETGR